MTEIHFDTNVERASFELNFYLKLTGLMLDINSVPTLQEHTYISITKANYV
jgi:hypothetical protein